MERTSAPGASIEWSCARKKAYGDERTARQIAARITDENHSGRGRSGYEGVTVVAYACTDGCGRFHIGRGR
jgi:hypothetical protein